MNKGCYVIYLKPWNIFKFPSYYLINGTNKTLQLACEWGRACSGFCCPSSSTATVCVESHYSDTAHLPLVSTLNHDMAGCDPPLSTQETHTGELFNTGRQMEARGETFWVSRWNTRRASVYWWLPGTTGHRTDADTLKTRKYCLKRVWVIHK